MAINSEIKSILKSIKHFCDRLPEAWEALLGKRTKSINLYSDKAPHPQNMLDLFQNDWASKLPPPYSTLKAGNANLFIDDRLEWALGHLGSMKGKKVLELGPLEGGHAYMMQQQGASVVSVEANPRAYLKCLIVKEILNLVHVKFLYGDFTKYLNEQPHPCDFCIACGVLYHMCNPVELIAQVAKVSPNIFVWTHYYDKVICEQHPKLQTQFKKQSSNTHEGFKHTLYKHDYGSIGKKFFGGPAAYSNWLSRDDILNACKSFGFTNIRISPEHDTPHHVNGPAFAFFASKDCL